ncbi:MAG: hypothetical protein IJ068_01805 [Bacilli bacterium]|nr:hypothetical protein [Bacilli bacterium]
MNDYFENYRSLKSEVDDACLTINSNSSTKLKDEVNELKENFNNLVVDEVWSDKVGDVFKEIVKKCSSSLNSVINSIENNFIKSDELYKNLKAKLEELEKANNDYREAYKSATAFVSVETNMKSREEVRAELENINVLEERAKSLVNDIENIKKELLAINDGVITKEEQSVEENIEVQATVANETPSVETNTESNSNNTINGSQIVLDSDQSVVQLANMCMAEQGSPEGAKFELSLLINQFKSVHGREPTSATELSEFMQNFGYGGGHWYAARTRNMASLTTADSSYINAITDVLSGNRVLPSNVVEHDCFSDIAKIVVNGQTLTDYSSISNHANYIRDNTVIYNKMGSVYTFYEFAPNGGDPFGYF